MDNDFQISPIVEEEVVLASFDFLSGSAGNYT